MVLKRGSFWAVCCGLCWSFLSFGEDLVVYKTRLASSSKTFTKIVGYEGEDRLYDEGGGYSPGRIPPSRYEKTKVTLWQVLIVRLTPDDAWIGEEDQKVVKPDEKAAKDAVKHCLEQSTVRPPLDRVTRQVQLAMELNVVTFPEEMKQAVSEFQYALDQCLAPSTPPGFQYLVEFKREKTETSWWEN